MHNLIQRREARHADQRSEPRLGDVVDRATIFFRGEHFHVPVIDISSRGTRIESDIVPRIGEAIIVQFDNCARIHAFVRWVKGGHVGLNFGHEIVLG